MFTAFQLNLMLMPMDWRKFERIARRDVMKFTIRRSLQCPMAIEQLLSALLDEAIERLSNELGKIALRVLICLNDSLSGYENRLKHNSLFDVFIRY